MRWYFKLVVVAALVGGVWFFQQQIAEGIKTTVQRVFLDFAWLWLLVSVFCFWKLGSHR